MGQKSPPHAFWAEMSACEHFVHIYENYAAFLNTLAEYTAGGLSQGHAVVIIATPPHHLGLSQRLISHDMNVAEAHSQGRLFYVDAEKTITKFMVNGHPDENLFNHTISEILEQAGAGGRSVRAFGEMVALMWANGHCSAAIKLEQFWDTLCRTKSFHLFCAYPRPIFTTNHTESLAQIRALHSSVLE